MNTMMAQLHNFNAAEVEPDFGFEPLPAGKYTAVITDSEMKQTKDGQSEYLELTFQILDDGAFKGRNLWARLNLANSNPQAVKFARAELSAICRAVGVLSPRDSVELHNIPLVVDVKCKKRKDIDEITNEIKGYERRAQMGFGAPQTAPAPIPYPHNNGVMQPPPPAPAPAPPPQQYQVPPQPQQYQAPPPAPAPIPQHYGLPPQQFQTPMQTAAPGSPPPYQR